MTQRETPGLKFPRVTNMEHLLFPVDDQRNSTAREAVPQERFRLSVLGYVTHKPPL